MCKTLLSVLSVLFLLTACNVTEQARSAAKPSGFLKDYSQMKTGGDDEALLIYKKPNVNWKKYTKIHVEQLEIWASKDSEITKMSKEDHKNVISFLNASMKKALGKDLTLTDKPGPSTMTLRVALTDGEASKPVMDSLSSVVPFTLALSYLKKVATGRHLAVGAASVEAEIIDSVTKERLMAGMDTRYGGKGIKGKFSSWDDVEEAFTFWSTRLAKKIKTLQK